jgi:hypothetical protein
MSKLITDEKIRLSIEINGNNAQKDLLELEKSTRKLNETNKQLLIEKKRLEAQGKKDTAEYRQLTATIKANNVVIDANKVKMQALQSQIGITGLTLTQLRQKATILRATLSNMIPGTQDFARFQAELSQVNARIGELTGRATQARFSLGSMADGFNRYQALALSFVATLTGVVLSIQKIIDMAGKLSDAQSDVMKTTGMTKKEVDELTKSFGLFQTRTSRMELLKLAEEAGRLGITGVDNIRAFTEEANKIKVALGDDLSDEAIREVGKMVNVYKVGEATGRDFAGSLNSLGSAINAVSASGANQAAYLVDYLKRQAGIVQITKLSAANNIGYAATFDELAISQEVSATAMNKIWLEMFKNPQDFAKVIGISVAQFKGYMEKDANEAMIMFLDAVNKNKGAAFALIESLKDIESGGTRGDNALMALAASTDLLRERQQQANKALMEATSIDDEYALKNYNLAASLEKIQKAINAIFTSEGFISFLESSVNWIAEFLGATDRAETSATSWRKGLVITAKVLAVLLAALITNVAWQKLVVLWTTRNTQATWLYNVGVKARAIAEGASIVVTQAYAAMTMLLRGNVIGATQALRVMTATMLTTPWGLLLAGVAALTTAYFMFRDSTEQASLSKKTFAKIQAEVTSGVKAERENLEMLVKIARDQNLTDEVRLTAIKKIKEQYPGLLDFLTLENINTNEVTAAVNRYIRSVENKIKIQAIEAELQSSRQRQLQKETADLEEFSSWYDGIGNFLLGNTGAAVSDKVSEAIKRRTTDIKSEADLQVALLEKLKEETEKSFADPVQVVNEDGTPAGETEEQKKKREEAAKKAEEARKKRLEDLRKSADEELKLRRELEDAILANMDESYQKEWQLEQTNWTRKIEDLQSRLVLESEIELAQKKANNSKLSSEERAFWASQAKSWQANNNHIYGLIQTAEQTHQLKLKTIREKAGKQLIETEKQAFDDAQLQREINHNLELAQLGTDEEAKRRLKEQYEKESLEAQEEFLNKQADKIQAMIDGASIGGIDYSLLSEEAKANLDRDLQVILLALAKIKAAQNGESAEGGSSNFDALGLQGATDILGFTPENWQTFFTNLEQGVFGIEQMTFAVTALSNMWAMYGQLVQANEQAQIRNFEQNTSRKQQRLKRQLDSGLISQSQYSRAVETIDAQLDKKKAEIEYAQAKRQKALAAMQIVTSTAAAILGIWKDVPKFDFGSSAFALSAMVGALGALQLATVMKAPLPARGYEEGLYPMVRREQDGKMFKATGGVQPMRSGLYKRSTILVGEGPGDQPEMVIDKKTFARISPSVQDALLREIRGVKGFEKGYYDNVGRMQVPAASTDLKPTDNDSAGMMMMAEALNRNSAILEKIDREGILAKVLANDYKSLENLKEGMEKYDQLKSKSRR